MLSLNLIDSLFENGTFPSLGPQRALSFVVATIIFLGHIFLISKILSIHLKLNQLGLQLAAMAAAGIWLSLAILDS